MIKKTFNFAKKVKMSIHSKIVETAITFDDVLLIPFLLKFLPKSSFSLNLEFQTKSRLMFYRFRSDGYRYKKQIWRLLLPPGLEFGFFHKICLFQNKRHK